MNNITGIILSGGKSSRMGSNKAFIPYQGELLIHRAVKILKPLCSELLISSNQYDERFGHLKMIPDEIKEIGPIGGLFSCLKASRNKINLVIPCDAPNVTSDFYRQLLKQCGGVDAVIPRLPDGKLEPLIACYHSSVIPVMETQIVKKEYKLVSMLNVLKVHYLEVQDSAIFKNLNTPSDLIS